MKEKEIIKYIKTFESVLPNSIGDDATYLPNYNLLISTDSLIENVHFTSKIAPYQVGWKTVAVNLSDIIAMGGIPEYFLLSASMPTEYTDEWLKNFLIGLNACLNQYNCKLIGGDLTLSENIALAGTALGYPRKKEIICYRYNAQVGQKVIITGIHGLSAGGLYALQNNLEPKFPNLVEAHCKPKPQLEKSKTLIEKAHPPLSMMDSSDGLLNCLREIAMQSNKKLKINLDNIPISEELMNLAKQTKQNYWNWVLVGGEDYELVATCEKEEIPENWIEIGEVIAEGEGLIITKEGKEMKEEQILEWSHFK